MSFDTFTVRTPNLLNHQKPLFFQWISMIFILQRNMIFDDFLDLFRYQFWHWFLIRFGIDFGSILGAFCNYFHVFSTSFFASIFWSTFWWKWYQNWSGITYPEPSFFVSFSITLVPFTHVIPTSARKQFFQFFFKKNKRIHPHLYLLLA